MTVTEGCGVAIEGGVEMSGGQHVEECGVTFDISYNDGETCIALHSGLAVDNSSTGLESLTQTSSGRVGVF